MLSFEWVRLTKCILTQAFIFITKRLCEKVPQLTSAFKSLRDVYNMCNIKFRSIQYVQRFKKTTDYFLPVLHIACAVDDAKVLVSCYYVNALSHDLEVAHTTQVAGLTAI